MKKKKKLYQQWQFWLMIVCIIAFISLIVTWDSEPHFKIYKEICEEIIPCIPVNDTFIDCRDYGRYEISCEQVEVDKDVKICIDKYKEEGNATWCIMSDVINIEWLNGNCDCLEKNCEYVFNVSKRAVFNMEEPEKFTSKTYEGIIWFTTDERGDLMAEYYEGDVELVEKCNPCQEYKCGEKFIVEVWNQIK